MFQVKIDTIRERTTNGPTYMKGRQYYRQGQIRHLVYDQEKGIILAQVEGTRTYTVRVILDGHGELHDASCTCSAFAAYWGLCRHIAAVLLYCVDTYGREKTHITPEKKPDAFLPRPEQTASTDQTARTEDAGQQAARQQAQRRSRGKTRDFLARLGHVLRLDDDHGKVTVRLQATLHCTRSSGTLPWLSFSVGLTQLCAIANVEQFAEAVSRDLPLELDKEFTFDPLIHQFRDEDMPLVRMLQDAFENDYKAVFGTSHASSRDRYFTLNASRFAHFLTIAPGLADCGWQMSGETERRPVQVRQANLPISLLLTAPDDAADTETACRLELICQHALQQMTASRNIYLVDDIFYMPQHEAIRLIEPILSTFNTPGYRHLMLSRDEASALISMAGDKLAQICPIHLQDSLQAILIDEPLSGTVELDLAAGGFKADVSWQYGPACINPCNGKSQDAAANTHFLVRRDFRKEDEILQTLQTAGFVQNGTSFRLTDPDSLYHFLDDGLERLQTLALVRLSEAASRIQIRPSPRIDIRFRWSERDMILYLEQSFDGLGSGEIPAYVQALRDRKPYLRNRDGSYRQVDLSSREALLAIIDLLQLWQVDPGAPVSRLPRYRALALEPFLPGSPAGESPAAGEPAASAFVPEPATGPVRMAVIPPADPAISSSASPADGPETSGPVQIDGRVRSMIDHLRHPGQLSFRIPAAVRKFLRPYQKTGVQWLCTLDHYGLGGILADDMGLGKTLQTIAYIHLIWNRRKKTSLIIAPTSLVYNWQSEFEKFSPGLPVLLIDGNRQQRSSLMQDIGRHACVITSYALLRRDIDEIASCDFDSCFLDEAQNIKNPDTLNARSVKMVRADHTFALTGTPLENSLLELWSIFDFILPGYLHSQRIFQNIYEIPITRDGNTELLRTLHRQIMPFILRRMKRDVLKELPDKIESRTICDMTEEQRQIYDAFLYRSRRDLEQEINQNGYARSQIYILALLTRLRQICCHPSLFLRQYEGGSGKLLLLEELLADSFSAGHRVLVFSQFTSMLEIIRDTQRTHGIEPFYIDGQVPSDERLSQVERFNGGQGQLFLVSLRAGGTGLNLTGADTVIHFDPWWNPAVEEQATDRAYRIGQENVVQVFKLCTRHSVEEKILTLQQRKQTLIDTIIKPGQNLLSKMTLDEVMSLFET